MRNSSAFDVRTETDVTTTRKITTEVKVKVEFKVKDKVKDKDKGKDKVKVKDKVKDRVKVVNGQREPPCACRPSCGQMASFRMKSIHVYPRRRSKQSVMPSLTT